MHTTMTTATSRHEHPPHTNYVAHATARRVGLVDRMALHLGIALIKWGRRPHALPPLQRRQHRAELELERQSREQQWERTARLFLPMR